MKEVIGKARKTQLLLPRRIMKEVIGKARKTQLLLPRRIIASNLKINE